MSSFCNGGETVLNAPGFPATKRLERMKNPAMRIGDLSLKNWSIMAPMAGITNLAFRLLIKQCGAGLVTTEMVSAKGLIVGHAKTREYLKTHSEEKPLAVQIFGSEPQVMARAAEMAVEAGADILDINMGCPAKKVVKTGAGGALLRNLPRAKEIVTAVRRICPRPLTVKIRTGWSPDQPVAIDMALLIEDCGADAITVHPRFVAQGFSGRADWSVIGEVKKWLRIPVIGNGDVNKPCLALKMKEETGCDGVMIGRGALGNPWIFRQISEMQRGLPLRTPKLVERKTMIMEHFRLLTLSMGEKRAAKTMRGLLLWYTKGLPHSSGLRGAITSVKDLQTLVLTMDRYFSTLAEMGH